MGLYAPCELSWIGSVVNNYIETKLPLQSAVDFDLCCTAPGTCVAKSSVPTCPLGALDCNMGNSRYVCRFNPTGGGPGSTCYSEGYLAKARAIPCCHSQLNNFFLTEQCLGAYGTIRDTMVCCSSPTSTSCKYSSFGCSTSNPYYCAGGTTSAICVAFMPGLSATDRCASEFDLVNEVSNICKSASPPAIGCTLGGAGTGYTELPSNTTAKPGGSDAAPTGGILLPSGAESNNRARVAKTKRLALCLVAVSLVQLIF